MSAAEIELPSQEPRKPPNPILSREGDDSFDHQNSMVNYDVDNEVVKSVTCAGSESSLRPNESRPSARNSARTVSSSSALSSGSARALSGVGEQLSTISRAVWGKHFKATSPSYYRLLLFAGVVKPINRFSPWWIMYAFWRFAAVVGAGCLVFLLVNIFHSTHTSRNEGEYIVNIEGNKSSIAILILIPAVLSHILAVYSWDWLPTKFESSVREDMLNSDDAEETIRLTVISEGEGRFGRQLSIWFVGIMLACSFVLNAGLLWVNEEELWYAFAVFCTCSSTVPLYGSILLALSMDVASSLIDVRSVKKSSCCEEFDARDIRADTAACD